MVATADRSLMGTSQFAQTGGRNSFFWTMVALAALDVVLLFGILNPPAKSADDFAHARLSASQARTTWGDAASKRSPLGAVATHVATKPSRNQSKPHDNLF